MSLSSVAPTTPGPYLPSEDIGWSVTGAGAAQLLTPSEYLERVVRVTHLISMGALHGRSLSAKEILHWADGPGTFDLGNGPHRLPPIADMARLSQMRTHVAQNTHKRSHLTTGRPPPSPTISDTADRVQESVQSPSVKKGADHTRIQLAFWELV